MNFFYFFNFLYLFIYLFFYYIIAKRHWSEENVVIMRCIYGKLVQCWCMYMCRPIYYVCIYVYVFCVLYWCNNKQLELDRVYVCGYVYVCVYICLFYMYSVCTCMHVYGLLSIYIGAYVCVCVCVRGGGHVYICSCMYIYIVVIRGIVGPWESAQPRRHMLSWMINYVA